MRPTHIIKNNLFHSKSIDLNATSTLMFNQISGYRDLTKIIQVITGRYPCYPHLTEEEKKVQIVYVTSPSHMVTCSPIGI